MEAVRQPAGPVRRILLASGIALAALNVWTGAPLLALWVGSRTQSGTQATMLGVFVVVVLFAVLCFVLVRVLAVLTALYDEATGAPPAPRRQAPWLRSLRGDRPDTARRQRDLSVPERIVITIVVVNFVAFEVWFFFFASSPLPSS